MPGAWRPGTDPNSFRPGVPPGSTGSLPVSKVCFERRDPGSIQVRTRSPPSSETNLRSILVSPRSRNRLRYLGTIDR
eukprot:scaffold1440_cov332-Pavlova_lutheri.AAC.11